MNDYNKHDPKRPINFVSILLRFLVSTMVNSYSHMHLKLQKIHDIYIR